MEILGVLLVVLIVAGIAAIKTITSLIYISGPNEVLVFSGTTRRVGRRKVGYKLIKGGRGIRIPLLEAVDRLDLTNLVIDVAVTGAYSKGGIPLNVQAVANVKIAGDEPVIHNALQRLLGKSRQEVITLARETLEGNLRGVLATLTPEQVNEDKNAFAQSLLKEAEQDLDALGLVLDTLKIQSVTDDQGYLQAIGRRQSAELMKSARMAEASARATAAITAASNREQTVLAQLEARIEIARAEAARRILDAQTRRTALTAEQLAEVAFLVARAAAEVDVQKARIEQVERQLQAEVIEPAIAARDRMIFDAEGHAARIVEDGRARAEAMNEISEVWSAYGESAKQALLMQKLEDVSQLLTSTIRPLDIEKLTVIDMTSDTPEDPNNKSWAWRAIRTSEEIKAATGVDLGAIARHWSGGSAKADAPAEARPRRAPRSEGASSDRGRGASTGAPSRGAWRVGGASDNTADKSASHSAGTAASTTSTASAASTGSAAGTGSAAAPAADTRASASRPTATASAEPGREAAGPSVGSAMVQALHERSRLLQEERAEGQGNPSQRLERAALATDLNRSGGGRDDQKSTSPVLQTTPAPIRRDSDAGASSTGRSGGRSADRELLHRRSSDRQERGWYVEIGGQARGPFSSLQLDEMLKNNIIREETLAWRKGMNDWQALRS